MNDRPSAAMVIAAACALFCLAAIFNPAAAAEDRSPPAVRRA